MYLAGSKFPFPTNVVLAPAMAAVAFATQMAFASGIDSVPGVGRGDTRAKFLGFASARMSDGLKSAAGFRFASS
jgi:hypothetical protein